ncbi:MAG TPA: 23S rRNA (uracil(1939)-C(5))-methyltransferase RlmD [Vicinamibacterales bacterium]|nr:23S rRNA (uracil(1939)-C(5))-methyltransferase RlmD [Vicinamibacterales bacterium]
MTGPLDLTIESIDAAGDGVARHRGRLVTVPFTIPGERVRVRLAPARGRTLSAALVDVLDPSPHRVAPRCAHFGPEASPRGAGPCGGCAWQHIAYPEQLRLKSSLVTRLVRAAVPRAPEARPTIGGADPASPWGYRHKVHFVFGSAAERGRRGAPPLVMGHYVRGSRRVIPVHECPVHDERGNRLAFRFRDAYARAQIGAADRRAGPSGPAGVLRSVAIRVGARTSELMATLVVSADTDKRLRAATRRVLESESALTSLHLNLHPRGDAFVFGQDTRRLAGAERMREEVAGVSFLTSPTAFFQTNVLAAEVLVKLVLEAVPAATSVLDLYAGAGLFALPLARRGNAVIAIEENRDAVDDGEASLRLNRIPASRCTFVARSVEAGLRSARAAEAAVVDPPRDGCSPDVVDELFGRLHPRTVAYVSCNPEALARDLARITAHRYRIVSMQPVDMFPHTAHVETVVVLAR